MGKKAKAVIQDAERGIHHIHISVISIVEIMYLSQKKRIKINLKETLDLINESVNYAIADLTPQIVTVAQDIVFPELHDRLIIATAKHMGIPLLTSDKRIRGEKIVETIWD
ncbi:MAG: hypothetical protein A2X55_08160 [Nitrospirae bacterium GWB2_47_37]|nr:MAG: hypothetical protein A2Z82_06405 [Nitrospirae bacterium GWA2_46_11]OGW24857.1 MAG: hypothetical protein A2X55_08160 [Nitrospirae bacterium GWB2_47_37]